MDAMFFSHFMVNKKGPLSRVWLAAHWDKKLTKAHIFEISIESSVEGILQPKVKMALRTTGHLLLGVVRIYSRKAKYLLADCNEAFVKIKMAFRPGMVDLPEGNREASLAAITLPEVFHDFENIGEMTIEMDTPSTLNQCRAEEITIKEDYGTLSLMADDAFGDIAFNDPDIANDATNIDEGFDHTGLVVAASDKPSEEETASEVVENQATEKALEAENPVCETEKEKSDQDTSGTTEGCGLFETGLFDDAPVGPVTEETPAVQQSEPQPQPKSSELSEDDLYGDFGPASVGLPSGPSSPGSVAPPNLATDMEAVLSAPEPPTDQRPVLENNADASANQTTLIQNDSEAFALAPLDATIYRGVERGRSKRKRKLIVDEIKNISGEEMKNQLSDTRDIITTLDLAPPTKRLMHWKETGGVEKLFALPGHVLQSKVLSRLYMRHLTTRPMEDESDEDRRFLDLEDPNDKSREYERASKRPRRQESELSDITPMETTPMEINQSTHVVLNSTLDVERDIQGLEINKEGELPPLKLLDQDLDNSQTILLDNIMQPAAAPVPEEVGEIEKSVVEPEKTAEELQKEAAANELFDSLTNKNAPVAQEEQQQEEQETNPTEADKNEQNNMLPLEDDDDVGGPASVGPPEEQLADETYEQFEERVHSKRASVMLHVMKRNLDAGYSIPFSAVVRGNKRKQVAQKFYTCLVLKKQQAIEMEQSKAYEEVYISKGLQYDDLFA